jgi:hypothetical protein
VPRSMMVSMQKNHNISYQKSNIYSNPDSPQQMKSSEVSSVRIESNLSNNNKILAKNQILQS